MKKEIKPPPKLEKFCHFHENNLATYICGNCGKSICYYCQKNYGMPYLCPECMPVWWEKKVKRERILCFGPVIIIIIVIISLFIYSILTIPDYNDNDYKYSSIYIEDEDIIPVLTTNGEPGTNKLDLMLKIYVTNNGNKDTEDVYIELYVMRNGTSRAEARSDTAIIKEEKTRVFFINTTLLGGEYDLQLRIWENGKIVERGVKTVKITEGDIQNIKAYEILEEEKTPAMSGEDEAKESGDSFGFGGGSFIYIPLLIIAAIVLPIFAWLFYQQRIKPPSQFHGGVQRTQQTLYQYQQQNPTQQAQPQIQQQPSPPTQQQYPPYPPRQ